MDDLSWILPDGQDMEEALEEMGHVGLPIGPLDGPPYVGRFHPGTLIEGTLRPEDLSNAFYAEYERLIGHEPDGFKLNPDGTVKITDEHGELIDWGISELIDYLNDISPSGWYFGAHFGDGADFGFWRVTG